MVDLGIRTEVDLQLWITFTIHISISIFVVHSYMYGWSLSHIVVPLRNSTAQLIFNIDYRASQDNHYIVNKNMIYEYGQD